MSFEDIKISNIKNLNEKAKFLYEVSLDYIKNNYIPLHELGFTKKDLEELDNLQNKFIVAFEQVIRNFYNK